MKQMLFMSSLLILALGCANHHCRQIPDAAQPVAIAPGSEETSISPTDQRHVKIYKYDGSLQCGQGKPISPEAMAKELKGIEVFSNQKRPDGLMHIQVCGSATGLANIYEILESDLPKAEKRGFKRWTFE